MSIRLPIPITFDGKTYREASLKSIKASVIADANKVVQRGDTYKAIQIFLTGCLESIEDVTDRHTISGLVGNMPYKTAWYLAIKAIMADEKDDGVEGMYPCPRCGEKKVCEYDKDEDLDTRDYLSQLGVHYKEDEDKDGLEFDLEKPVQILDVDKNVRTIEKLEMAFPTLNHCSRAFGKVGDKDTIRMQFAVYTQALKKVDGEEVDNRFRNSFGIHIFGEMERRDIMKIGDEVDKYGLETEIEKICNKCGKEFKANINTSNFFVSALR